VAELVLRGYPNPVIASTLGIASATTKRHLTRIFDKIGVDSRTQLVSRLA
jgi:DNA-binding NarL/FixJ family response regulator